MSRLSSRKLSVLASYIYDGAGNKPGTRSRISYFSDRPLTTYAIQQPCRAEDRDYIGNYEFKNGRVHRVNTPYGYITMGVFIPYERDYQGNNRNHASYYSYGLPVQGSEVKDSDPYLYGGKEFYSLRGVNIYDFHARTYAPDIARFMQPDPLATENHGVSPYIYCNGDPINFIDPTGCKIKISNNKSGAIYNIAKIAATNMGNMVLRRLIDSNKIYTLTGAYFSMSSEFSVDDLKIRYVSDPYLDKFDGAAYSSLTAMSHESMHAYDFDGNLWDKENTGRAKGYIEGRAVSFENYIRESYGLYPLREKYGNNRQVQALHAFACDNNVTDFSLKYSSKDGRIMAYSYKKTTVLPAIYYNGILFAPKRTDVSTNYVIVLLDENGYVDYEVCSSIDEYNEKIKSYGYN